MIQKVKQTKNAITVKDEIYKYVVSIEQRIKSLDQKIYVSARCLKQIIDLAKGWAIINNKEYVTHQDIKDTIPSILRHRIRFLNPDEKIEFVNKEILEKKSSAFFSVNVVARKPEKNTPETNPYMQKFLKISMLKNGINKWCYYRTLCKYN